jgi:hypothetical protein
MLKSIALALIVPAALAFGRDHAAGRSGSHPTDLTVHEWGTFTTVAGENGRAIDWVPLGGPSDLPCFVEHFQGNPLVKVLPNQPRVDFESIRSAMSGKVRMETPVLYFYTPREIVADVRVRFPRGLMTEWYPHATVTQPNVSTQSLHDANEVSVIQWNHVVVAPGAARPFLSGDPSSHYFAARATDATPLAVSAQAEKFLFYRGVAGFDVPLSAQALPNGAVHIANLGHQPLPSVLLFERRGNAVGFRVHGTLADGLTLPSPTLDRSVEVLRQELTRMLVSAGLYPREAAAMLDTWRDSWFEEGARVFYVFPASAVSSVLPLEITPAPDHMQRVFVGRMELITPAAEATVEAAIARNDLAALAPYARFLGPITDRLLVKNPAARGRVQEVTNAALAAYVTRAAVCE